MEIFKITLSEMPFPAILFCVKESDITCQTPNNDNNYYARPSAPKEIQNTAL